MKVKKEKDNSYYMEEILLKKVENGQTKYLIKWEGFSHAENTWEPKSNLHAAEVQAFEDKLAKEAEQFAERGNLSFLVLQNAKFGSGRFRWLFVRR